MNKGKAKKNMKGNKRFTKRRHCGRKKMNMTGKRKTRNLRKKRGNVTRRRGRKIIGGGYDDNTLFGYIMSKNENGTGINYKDGRIYIKKDDFGENRNKFNELLKDKYKYFFVDYLDEVDEVDNHGKKLELGYYQGLLMDPKLKNATVFIKNPEQSDFLTFKKRDETQQNIPRTDLYINENRTTDMDDVEFFNSNIIDKLYYYPFTTNIGNIFRSTLSNYLKIPTFSLGISSNKNIVSKVVKNDKDDLRERSSTASTYSDSSDDDHSNSKEKTYKPIKSIADMKEKIKGGYSFAKLDDNGNYIDYSVCRKGRNEDEILCDYINKKGQDETDTITLEDIDNKKIFYLEK
jgi:hypothetical protein